MSQEAHRRYRILGLLGQGGHGKVYLARLETDNFRKDVAIKILRADQPGRQSLRRFRDEARFLGLIRDRAIVGVDAPVQLNGQWAVVMEYVQGCTLARLLRAQGPVPPSVALEIILEIARALDKVYHHPGPDGRPLRLLHRDLKPGNIQLTAYGEVKILDFGVARAELVDREAKTRNVIMGTGAYIAPERFDGIEVPSGDIYSLGVVLEELLLGRRGKDRTQIDPDTVEDPSLAAALQLAGQMTRRDPEARPTARDVEHRSEVLLDAFGRTQSLRSFSERVVPQHSRISQDELAGELLSEDHAISNADPESAPNPPEVGATTPSATAPSATAPSATAPSATAPSATAPSTTAPGRPVVQPLLPEPLPIPSRRRGLLKFAGVGLFGLSLGALGLVIGSGAATAVYLSQSPGGTSPLAPEPDPLAETREASPVGPTEDDGLDLLTTALQPPGDPVWTEGSEVRSPAPSSTSTHTEPDLILGRGRTAVIELDVHPTALRATSGLAVVPIPPHVALSARRTGLATFALEHRGGGRSWTVEIRDSPETPPEGSLPLVPAEILILTPGSSAVCTLAAEPRATVLPESGGLKIEHLGEGWFYLHPESPGWFDAVFQLPGGPRILTLASIADPPQNAPLPEGCTVMASDALRIPLGGELVVPTGLPTTQILVSQPGLLDVQRIGDDTEKVLIRAMRAGRAILVVSSSGHEPWIREVQVQ